LPDYKPKKKMKTQRFYAALPALVLAAGLVSCSKDDDPVKIHDMTTAEKVTVDRFSAAAGHLQVRTATNGLPAANAPVNFDQGPFITKGKGPNGQNVEYYNFDIQPSMPAPIYVLFREGESMPVDGQPNIINVLPGETGYNDFWQINRVTVPKGYKANQVASYDEIVAAGYPVQATTDLVNCPVVPEGSTATKRLTNESNGLTTGWYKGKLVRYFNFGEKALTASGGNVPVATIFVAFNVNVDSGNPNSGPASGFVVESQASQQTHNVVSALPSDAGYSPLWVVDAYNNSSFSTVMNLQTAIAAPAAGTGLGLVNCPIVTIQ
jgi:hypothetical protein